MTVRQLLLQILGHIPPGSTSFHIEDDHIIYINAMERKVIPVPLGAYEARKLEEAGLVRHLGRLLDDELEG